MKIEPTLNDAILGTIILSVFITHWVGYWGPLFGGMFGMAFGAVAWTYSRYGRSSRTAGATIGFCGMLGLFGGSVGLL